MNDSKIFQTPATLGEAIREAQKELAEVAPDLGVDAENQTITTIVERHVREWLATRFTEHTLAMRENPMRAAVAYSIWKSIFPNEEVTNEERK